MIAAYFLAAAACAHAAVVVPPDEALRVGKKVWQNEAGGTVEKLTHWNQGEDFVSLGIGHFIWYTAAKPGPFEESFPAMLAYLRQNGARPPEWLTSTPHCPWPDRDAFYKDFHAPRLESLRAFLSDEDNVARQARFMAERLEQALPKMLTALPTENRAHVREEFDRVYRSPGGLYPLLDYVNFKGEGVSPSERYLGQGWGLLQVLEGMQGAQPGQACLDDFARSADEVLTRRVRNSPPERGEARWLGNWKRRVETYRRP